MRIRKLDMETNKISFFTWFLKGFGGSKSGLKRIFDGWLIFHILIGISLAFIIDTPIKDVSRVILLPLMGILIGLTFAWAGNAQGFIQTKEIIEVSKNKPGGYIDYIFIYQFSIFSVLLCTGVWAIAAFDIKQIDCFDRPVHPRFLTYLQKTGIKSILYFTLSFTIREAWSTIQGVHYFLIVKNKIYENNVNKSMELPKENENKELPKETIPNPKKINSTGARKVNSNKKRKNKK